MIFHTSGAVLSTAIALMVANVANLMILKVPSSTLQIHWFKLLKFSFIV